MLETIEAIVDEKGSVRFLENVHFDKPRRVLITILKDDEPFDERWSSALLSEPALAKDWNRPEEDDAWAHLQPDDKARQYGCYD